MLQGWVIWRVSKAHKRILKAIRAGDELQVAQVMQAHVELARARSLGKPGQQ
jgi:DNA-binding GntR family transcriptional regulator